MPGTKINSTTIALSAVYLTYAALVIRTLALEVIRPRLPLYLALEFLFGLFFSLSLWRPLRKPAWQHLYFVFQAGLVLYLLSLRPWFDFIVVLFVLLSYQSALVFNGQARWAWVAVLTALTCLPLMVWIGALEGLAVALLPMTVGIVFPAYAAISQEIEGGQKKRQALLAELQLTNQQLTAYSKQVEEFSAVEERSRLINELRDSVTHTMFSINLHIRAAQILLSRDPERLRPQLLELQRLTQAALAEMRGLIAQLRPSASEPVEHPTS